MLFYGWSCDCASCINGKSRVELPSPSEAICLPLNAMECEKFYAQLKDWSVYYLKEMLMRFMIKQAVEHLKPVFGKSAATQSRAGMTLSIDNSVMDRFG